MKNKKTFLISFFVLIFIAIIFFIFFWLRDSSSTTPLQNEIAEYTPHEEISDTEVRNTIISLYFKHIETNSLIAEAKCIDVKDLYADPYSYLIGLLIAGPQSEKLESAIPEGTKVNSCVRQGNIVLVDLSKEFIENAPAGIHEESLAVYSIVNTLTELNEVSGVKILINGEKDLAFKDGKISFQTVFAKND